MTSVRAVVITVSDRSASGAREDRSGPLLVALLREFAVDVNQPVVVADDPAAIESALKSALETEPDAILTTGGTGISPRDVTPEATKPFLDRELPGIAEAIRARGRASTPRAALSRGLAGVNGRTLLVNLPGSSGGVRDGMSVLGPLLRHVADQLRGGDHE